MKVRQVDGSISGRAPKLKALIDGLSDVEEKDRTSAVPTWAAKLGVRRHIFNWLNYAKLVNLYVEPRKDGSFKFDVRIKFFLKGWSFAVTPEVALLMVNIVHSMAQDGIPTDFILTFRDRKVYLPFELVGRFLTSIDVVLHYQGPRVVSFHESMNQAATEDRQAEEDADDGVPLKETNRVLH